MIVSDFISRRLRVDRETEGMINTTLDEKGWIFWPLMPSQSSVKNPFKIGLLHIYEAG